jgi:hypothetical protein
VNLQRQLIVLVAVAAAAMGAGTAVVQAQPYEQVRFDEQGSDLVDDYCGDLNVRIDFHDQGVVVGREAGKSRLLRYTQSHHGGSTITNLATGRAFSFTWNYLNQDVQIVDNGDGTITILAQIPGPELIYGPDGQLLYTNGGTFRLQTVLDDGGTPNDPSDDTVLSEEVVSSNGGKPQGEFHLCDSFRTLTG